jgi:type II secretory ATPase GspE/PulE/Tfp pilus assembly ATPase PilB-like protein
VVTIPTAGGLEDVVMRILAAPRALSLEQLGMPPRDLDHLEQLAVYDVLANTPAVKNAIQQKAPSDEILRLAVADGMTTLEQDALDKTMQGHLDLKQVLASCR